MKKKLKIGNLVRFKREYIDGYLSFYDYKNYEGIGIILKYYKHFVLYEILVLKIDRRKNVEDIKILKRKRKNIEKL
jgi:uncharacterized protein (DUF39 family)